MHSLKQSKRNPSILLSILNLRYTCAVHEASYSYSPIHFLIFVIDIFICNIVSGSLAAKNMASLFNLYRYMMYNKRTEVLKG